MKKFNPFLQKIINNNGNGCLCFLRPGITGIIICTLFRRCKFELGSSLLLGMCFCNKEHLWPTGQYSFDMRCQLSNYEAREFK